MVTEGFAVTTAEDGFVGLQRMLAQDFDLVILDLQMPRMDGRAMFAEMRMQGFTVPVLILSAYGADAARSELQADAALDKPFEVTVLVNRVRSLLSRH